MIKPNDFGLSKKETIYEKYIGKWMLFKTHNDWEAGKFNRIEDGYAILNPYQGLDLEGKAVSALIEEEAGMRLDAITSYRVMSKETILANCAGANKYPEIRRENSLKSFLRKFLRL